MATAVQTHEIVIEIGGMPVCVRTESAEFRQMLQDRYVGFVMPASRASRPGAAAPRDPFSLEVELLPEGAVGADEDVRVRHQDGRWLMTRGDFRAEYEPEQRRGRVRQTANPYAIDSVLRILHTLLLAEEGGFLLHAASAIRNGKAFLFSGKSEAGKTTISRLAPGDVTLLTDEISYIRKSLGRSRGPSTRGAKAPLAQDDRGEGLLTGKDYVAYGTPFAGELAKVGDNVSAPIAALYFLEKARENRIVPVGQAEALQRLMQNILFFAEDERLVRQVFEAAGEFLLRVPVFRLQFVPDKRVWELIG